MIDEDLKDTINNEIFKSLDILELKDYNDQKNYYPVSMSQDLSLNEYNKIDDIVYHGAPLLHFIDDAVDSRFYSLNILNYQGVLAIEKLGKDIFKVIEEHIDLDLIVEFNLINSNIVSVIEPDLFQPLKSCLQSVTLSDSYLPVIPKELFKGLELNELIVMSNKIKYSDPLFGLQDIKDISNRFTLIWNSIGNENELKVHDFIHNFKTEKVEIKY